ncbi:MAG: hypothetical protein R2695_11620 [Acidimicrobiales bacterium]
MPLDSHWRRAAHWAAVGSPFVAVAETAGGAVVVGGGGGAVVVVVGRPSARGSGRGGGLRCGRRVGFGSADLGGERRGLLERLGAG